MLGSKGAMCSRQHTQACLNTSLSIRQEIQRFESVHPSIYALYDLVELVPDPLLAQQIRDHVVAIEGLYEPFYYDPFGFVYIHKRPFLRRRTLLFMAGVDKSRWDNLTSGRILILFIMSRFCYFTLLYSFALKYILVV